MGGLGRGSLGLLAVGGFSLGGRVGGGPGEGGPLKKAGRVILHDRKTPPSRTFRLKG